MSKNNISNADIVTALERVVFILDGENKYRHDEDEIDDCLFILRVLIDKIKEK